MDVWKRYRKLRNVFLLAFSAYVPIVFCATYLFVRFRAYWLGYPFPLACTVSLLITWIRLSQWRCPRCGKWFTAKWWYNKGFFARKCVHCGLPKYAKHP
jgi:hypothetical protein